MSKIIRTKEDVRNLKVDDNITIVSKSGKIINGLIETELTNRGYVDIDELQVFVPEVDYTITVNVTKFINGTGSIKEFILN